MSTNWTTRAVALASVFTLGLALSPGQAKAQAGGEAVSTLYSTLTDVMRNGRALGPQGRYARIEPIINRVFDMPLMTRLAVGPSWASLNEAQKQQVTQAFNHYIAAVYAERFDSYAGERLEVTGQQASGAGTIVTSRIVKSTGEPVQINYLMQGGRIADIYLNGTISELATRRSEFAAILRTQGVDGLIATLNGKAAQLGAARTS